MTEMRYGDYIQESFQVVRANLVPSLVYGLACMIPLAGPIVTVNYLGLFKEARAQGKAMDIAALFNFENVADKFLGPFVGGLAFLCCCLPGFMLLFTAPLLADKPGLAWTKALGAAFAFGKANLVPTLVLGLVVGLVAALGSLAFGIGTIITFPIAQGALLLAYEDQRPGLEAAAAEAGVAL